MNRKYKKLKFTIIELLAAMSIIMILAGITVGTFSLISTKSRNYKTEATIKKIELAMISYKHDVGYYFQQSASGSLAINSSDSEFLKHIDYTTMKQSGEINNDDNLIDAWGNEIIYQCPGANNRTMFDLMSNGKDGNDNSGANDDITNFSRN